MSQVRPIEDLFAELIELNTAASARPTSTKYVAKIEELRSRLEKALGRQ